MENTINWRTVDRGWHGVMGQSIKSPDGSTGHVILVEFADQLINATAPTKAGRFSGSRRVRVHKDPELEEWRLNRLRWAISRVKSRVQRLSGS